MMAENTRYQTVQACAGEAMDALFSVYCADSFDADLLESRLAETIHFFTRNAQKLTALNSNSDAAESVDVSSHMLSRPLNGNHAGGGSDVV